MNPTCSLPVRILYTINANPQYILARSHGNLPTTIISPYNNGTQVREADGQPAYATCALKACLNAICRSSPELVQDSMRDFSVYVLDPLESMSPSGSSTSTPNDPRGVAIGLGLMSWALLADEDDSVEVTGTVIKQGNGMGALEVIFSLKETTHMQKASLSRTLKSWGLHSQTPSLTPRLPPTASTSKRSKSYRSSLTTTIHSEDTPASNTSIRRTSSAAKKPPSPPFTTSVFSLTPAPTSTSPYDTHVTPNLSSAHSANPTTSNSNFLSSSNPTPPSGIEAGKTERRYARSSDFPTSDSAIYLGPPRRIGRPPKSTQSNSKPNTKPKPNGPKPFITPRRQDVFTRVPLPVPAGSARQIEERDGKGKERESVGGQGDADDDLQSLLAALSSASASSSSTENGTALLTALAAIDSTSGEGNGALVTALKELLAHVSVLPSPPKPTVNPASIYTTTSSDQANHDRSSSDDVIVLDKENVNPEVFRRRSEKDKGNSGGIAGSGAGTEKRGLGGSSNANSTAGRKRTLSDFMEEKEKEKAKNKTRSRARAGSRSVHSLSSSSSLHVHRSSGSQYYRSATDTLPSRAHTSPPRPKPFRQVFTTASYTAPVVASSPAPAPGVKTKKPFVLPAWARTTNPTQPRLSEEALKAKERVEAEAEAERERTKKRRGSRRARDNQNEDQNEQQKEKTSMQKKDTHANGKPQLTADTRAQTLSFPVCASSDLTVISPSSPIPASSPSEGGGDASDVASHAPSQVPRTPPPRTRRRHTLATKNIGTSGGSALFTPTPRKMMGGLFGDSPLLSPSAFKSGSTLQAKAKVSPIQAIATGRADDSGEDDENDKFNKQLSDALEEEDPEFPPSSLPIASSDFDADPPTTSSSDGQPATEMTVDEDETMRFWSSGLPPSSPPPPTSPVLQAQTDDEEMDDLSTIPSDSEGFVFEPELQERQQPLSATSSDFESEFPFSDDMGMCFDDFNQLFSDHVTWTHNDAAEDTPMPLANGRDGTIQNGLNDLDFNQFWESVKPLVGNQSMMAGEDMFAQQDGGEVDHAKLAADVQALFSGCLM